MALNMNCIILVPKPVLCNVVYNLVLESDIESWQTCWPGADTAYDRAGFLV